MKQGLWLLILLAACGADAAGTAEYPIRSSNEADGTKIGWYVSDAHFLKTPKWIFDGKNSPPLDMPAAHQRAYDWLKRSFPKMSSFKLRSYGLFSSGNSRAPDRWYYTFDFVGDLDGSMVMNSRFSVVVLMDGEIVEPREVK